MKSTAGDPARLRLEALAARAALQRVQLRLAVGRLREAATAPRSIGAAALVLARLVTTRRSSPGGGVSAARPWMLSAGLLLVRAARRHPTLRWLVGAGAAGAAVWWVVRALNRPDSLDDSG